MTQTPLADSSIVIVSAKRTPIGGFMGALSPLSSPVLGAAAIKATIEETRIATDLIDEVIMGCVLPAGVGQAPARQACLAAGLDLSTGATTINKVCGSGMKALMLAHDIIKAGSANVVIAGGMESMSNAPHLLPSLRGGKKMGSDTLLDHMMHDGLENAYDGKAMGCFAQTMADSQSINREAMDAFALQSLNKAKDAISSGAFEHELTSIEVAQRKTTYLVSTDEGPETARPEKIPTLRPAFAKDGTVTAANSSSISDGAAALLITTATHAKALKLAPLAKIRQHTTHAMAPEDFTIAPVGAIDALLDKVGWRKDEVDLFEINEAFAMVTMLAIEKLGLDQDKVNVNGGACTLGHPIGASGARIVVTLIHALKNRGLTKGIAALCIGGGEATAIAVELC